MAQLKQPSASVNSKASMNTAPETYTGRPARPSALPVAAALAAIAIGAGALMYYQSQQQEDTGAAIPQPTTSDTTASAPAAATQPSTESAPSAMQSATTAPKTGADESAGRPTANAASSVHPNTTKPHRVAKVSKPAATREPRDRLIALVNIPHPQYPLQALRAGEQGTVRVLAQVNAKGDVIDARVVGHSGSSILDRAAPKEVRSWKFDPAMQNGRPIVASIEVPVNYRLNQ
jgi:TonB family protein